MSASKLDAVYRSILITKFFTKGWGKPDNLRRLFEFRKIVSDREECYKLIPNDYPVTITREEKRSDHHILEGHFLSPLETLLPGVVPQCAHHAHFQVFMPTQWPQKDCKPMCVHLAGTGDHFFWRRRNLMARPLLKEGIGAIILENPFYGLRKPVDQVRSSLHNVSDIFVMGGCLILETMVLLHWCERNGLGPLGVTGLSMGGHMASLAATNWPRPLVLVPCLSWSTASAVFTQGVMSHSINWELLENQFFSDGEYRDKLAKMVTIVDEAFLAGRKFAQRFSKHNESTKTINSFNLPAILNNMPTEIKTFDITNPNNLSSCQGLAPEFTQKYSVIPKESIENKNEVMTIESLITDNKISENLYNKITSDRKFNLDPSEISELNKLALESAENKLHENDTNKTNCVKTDDKNTSLSNTECKDNLKSSCNEIKNCDNSLNSVKNVEQTDCLVSSESNVQKSSAICSETKSEQVLTVSSNPNTENKDNVTNVQSKIIQNILTRTDTEEVTAKPSSSKSTTNSAMKLFSSLPFLGKKEEVKENWRNREALQFMRGVMDECTHLGNFSIPYDTSLIIAVCAKNDAYVPRGDTGALEELWPGAEVRYIDAGHVSAYVLHQSLFRSCIVEAFERSKKKWSDGKHKA